MTSYTLQVQPRKQYVLQYSNQRGPQGPSGTGGGSDVTAGEGILVTDIGASKEVAIDTDFLDLAYASLFAPNIFAAKQSFSGVNHAGLQLNSLTTAEYNALTATAGDLFRDSTMDRVNARLNRGTVELIDSAGGQIIAGTLRTSGRLTASTGINVPNNQTIEFARTTGFVGWFSLRVSATDQLVLQANNASLSLDPISGVVTSAGSIQIGGATGPLVRNNGGVAEVRNAANTSDSNWRCSQLIESSVSATGTGGIVRATSPTLTTPALGNATATSLVVTNGTTLGVRTIATLPLASTVPGQSFRVSDSPVTANRIVTSDGVDWHYEGLPYNIGTRVAGSIVIKIDTTTTGQKNLFLRVPYACTIVSWELAANASGSVVIDIWEDTYANYPPVNADSITGTAKPTITAGTRAQSSTLTGWVTSLAAGDYLEVEVESVTTITSVTLTLNVERVS